MKAQIESPLFARHVALMNNTMFHDKSHAPRELAEST
jgi:hypothetical protein